MTGKLTLREPENQKWVLVDGSGTELPYGTAVGGVEYPWEVTDWAIRND